MCTVVNRSAAFAGIQVYPRLINIGPQVNIGYPATPPPAKKAAAKAATPGALNGSNAGQAPAGTPTRMPCL